MHPHNTNSSSRNIHAYCIGTQKSGTHSIAGIFQPYYQSAHEAESHELIEYLINQGEKNRNEVQEKRYLKARDRRLSLDMESSAILGFLTETLVAAFPQAKFICPMRDCYSWLDSCINHQLNNTPLRERSQFWEGHRN